MHLPIEAYEDRTEAVKYLAEQLRNGTLALMSGAGAGMPLGLPKWDQLVEHCLDEVGLSATPGGDLEIEASRVAEQCKRSKIDLRDVVHRALYSRGVPSARDLTSSPRLAALGALLMGSRRGSVQTVVTFNYDSLLESYLALHGYCSRVVSSLPSLHGAEDVTIFHPHGYLPADSTLGPRSSELILTKESFNQQLGDSNGPWMAVMRHIVRTKVLLLIGISDKTLVGAPLGPMLQNDAPTLKFRGPTAIWLTGPNVDGGILQVVRNENVAAVRLPDYDVVDDFLLEICRKAASEMVAVY